MSHVLRAIIRVRKKSRHGFPITLFFSLLQKRDHCNKMKMRGSKLHFKASTQRQASALLIYLDLRSSRFLSVNQTWRSLSKSLNLGPLYLRIELIGLGKKKFIFKLHSLISDYNFKYINIQFPHLKQKPQLKEYTMASNSIIVKTMQEAKTY